MTALSPVRIIFAGKLRAIIVMVPFWTIGRLALAAGMVFAGTMHFLHTDMFAQIVPPFIPSHRAVVQISGFFEIAGGIGLLVRKVSYWAALGLILLFIAVFPANIYMAVTNMAIAGRHYPILLWLRLPVQPLLVFWAYLYSRRARASTAEKNYNSA